jgi:hypothetical protein
MWLYIASGNKQKWLALPGNKKRPFVGYRKRPFAGHRKRPLVGCKKKLLVEKERRQKASGKHKKRPIVWLESVLLLLLIGSDSYNWPRRERRQGRGKGKLNAADRKKSGPKKRR